MLLFGIKKSLGRGWNMKKLIFACIVAIITAVIAPAMAAPVAGDYDFNNITQHQRQEIKQALDIYKDSPDYIRHQEHYGVKREITWSVDDVIAVNVVPFYYGEAWSELKDINRLINISTRMFYLPMEIDQVGRIMAVFNEISNGKLRMGPVSLDEWYKGFGWLDAVYNENKLKAIKQEIGTEEIKNIIILTSNSYQESVIYFDTPKGEYVAHYGTGIEGSELMKLEDFLSARIQVEKDIKNGKYSGENGGFFYGGSAVEAAGRISEQGSAKQTEKLKIYISLIEALVAIVIASVIAVKRSNAKG